jgi:hypothetical protein
LKRFNFFQQPVKTLPLSIVPVNPLPKLLYPSPSFIAGIIVGTLIANRMDEVPFKEVVLILIIAAGVVTMAISVSKLI